MLLSEVWEYTLTLIFIQQPSIVIKQQITYVFIVVLCSFRTPCIFRYNYIIVVFKGLKSFIYKCRAKRISPCFIMIISFVIVKLFILTSICRHIAQRTLSSLILVEHSWVDYIYSLPMRYSGL